MNYSPNLICRLCLLDGSGNVSIFTNYNESRDGLLAHKIMQIANVQVYEGDGLPALICRVCMARVEGFFQFKVQIEKSDFFLRQQVCTYQGDVLTPTTVENSSENVKSEPLPVLKNGVYLSDNTWTDTVPSFPALPNCESLTDDSVTVSTSQEVTDVLTEESHSTFVDLANESNREDKCLLDLTQQEGKVTEQTNDSANSFEDDVISVESSQVYKKSVVGGEKSTDVYYMNNFFNRNYNLSQGNLKVHEKDKEFYNLDQNKESNRTENTVGNSEIDKTFQLIEKTGHAGDEDNNDEEEYFDSSCHENDVSKPEEETLGSKTNKITYSKECDKHFDKPVSLKKHQSLHSKESSYKCSFCNKSFRQSWYLQSHIRTHTGERPFVCSICSKTFTDKSSLSAHMKVAHYMEKTHVCKFCGKAFKLRKQLERHERIHTGHQYHRCEICGKLFTQKSNLMKHSVLHSGEKPYVCTVCEKPFAQKDNLNIHILRHHSQQNPVVCDVCGKVFKNKMTLMGHKKSKHSDNVKPIICEVCGKFFPDRSCLNSHKWVHSSGAPVQCDICGKSYPHARAVRVHKRVVHSEVRKYCCDVCGIGFKTSQTLKHHKVVHTGERAFSCDECGRSFGQKTALKTHQRTHSGIEPYSCPRCGESFKWKQTCDKHIMKCVGKPRCDYIIMVDNPTVP